MAAKPNGEPFIDLINFGSHYCSMYRWDDAENWTILREKGVGRKIFPNATVARTETLRILTARRKIRSEHVEDADPLGIESWRAEKAESIAAERRRVFGEAGQGTIFLRGGRQVEVVVAKKRVKAI
jgi:hypothetical protein